MYVFAKLLDRCVSVALYEGGNGGFFRGIRKLGTLGIMGFQYRGGNRVIEGRRSGVLAVN